MYLLDTNVVSELRSTRNRKPDGHVAAWAKGVSATSLYLSAISILEIEMGILQKDRSDTKQAAVLRAWLEDHVLRAFSGRILFVEVAVAKRCAALHVPGPCSYRDSLIAATALVYGLTLVTRNASHFHRTGVSIINPWQP